MDGVSLLTTKRDTYSTLRALAPNFFLKMMFRSKIGFVLHILAVN